VSTELLVRGVSMRFVRTGSGILPAVAGSTIGKNVRRLRERAGLSAKHFASAAGVSPPRLSEVEGDYGQPKVDTLLRVAKALRCSIDDLLLGVDREYDAIVAKERGRGLPPFQSKALEVVAQVPHEQQELFLSVIDGFIARRSPAAPPLDTRAGAEAPSPGGAARGVGVPSARRRAGGRR
jgi:transcriptional regulator with XRE-family HTH domain